MTGEAYISYVLTLSTQVAAEPTAQPILDANMAIKVLLPVVLREVIRRNLKNGGQIKNLIKSHTVKATGGSFELPEGVREEFADLMMVGTSDSDLGLFTYIPHYFDFIRETSYILPRFTLRDGRLYAAKTGATLSTLILYALTEPVIESESDEIEVDEALMDECLALTASILRGEISLASLGISREMATQK